MLLISNNIESLGMKFPEDVVVRINTAWVNTYEALDKELKRLEAYNLPIYLDYPIGRKKPPLPKMTWENILEFAYNCKLVKYVAWSNAEKPEALLEARKDLPDSVMLVPKIETLIGVLNLEEIVKASQTKVIMIDKEDLASAANDPIVYQHFLEYARKKADTLNVKAIELKAVVFN